MLSFVPGQLEPKVSLDRCADVRRSAFIDRPSTIFVLAIQDIPSRLLNTRGIARGQERVQQDVVGLERGIGAQFTAPISFLILNREQISTGTVHGDGHTGLQIVNLAKQHLRGAALCALCFVHITYSTATTDGAAAMASTISGGNPKRTFSVLTSSSST